MKTLILVLACLLQPALAVATPAGSSAASRPSASQAAQDDRARQLFEQAVDRLEAGRFADARELLESSLELKRHPSTAFNLAVACRGMGDVLCATRLLEALEAGEFGKLTNQQAAEVRRLKGTLAAEIAELTLRVEGVGSEPATVRIDGQVVGSTGDLLVVPVNPGKRLLTVTAQDRVPVERTVHAEPGATVQLSITLPVTPEARVGRLIIEAPERRDLIEIPGVASGTGRLERTVSPGEYTVRVSNPKGSRTTTLVVQPRSTVRYQFDSVTPKLHERPLFWVGVASVVAAATVATILWTQSGPRPVSDPTYGTVVTGVRFP